MSQIRTYIQSLIDKKLNKHRCVVIYDPSELYADLTSELVGPADAPRAVWVSALPGPTTALLHAWEIWAGLPSGLPLLLYVAAPAPRGETAQRADPFWALAKASSTFGCEDHEQYEQLARQCFPEQQSKITELFKAGLPPFGVLDSLGSGESWPVLSHHLPGNKSRRELLRALMLPRSQEDTRLQSSNDWIDEAQRLTELGLGVRLTENSLPNIRRKLWQLVLMGEFVLDLVCPLPSALHGVERASEQARDLVLRLADDLRQHPTEYLEQATALATQLNLAGHFGPEDDLGQRLTFGFEDVTLLGQLLRAIHAGQLKEAAEKLRLRKQSVWSNQRATSWEVAEAGLALHQAVTEARAFISTEKLNDSSSLVRAYASRLFQPDAAQRRFEAAVSHYEISAEALLPTGQLPVERPEISRFIQECRELHGAFAMELQSRLLTGVEQQGWPATGVLSARELTSKLIQPSQQQGRRIAYFLVDALRYEVADELRVLLSEQGASVEMQPYCAQLPTSTPIGMSVLLPHDGHWTIGAGADGKAEPQAGQPAVPVGDAAARDQFWVRHQGDRVRVFSQENWLTTSPDSIPATVSLLIVRSTDFDKAGEHNGIHGLEQFPRALRSLRRAVLLAGAAGFREIVMATDHGFVLDPTPTDGNLIPAPTGKWALKKSRALLGQAMQSLGGTIQFDSPQVSIPGPFPHLVVPRTTSSFVRGRSYAHEGISPAEVVLPVLQIQLPGPEKATPITQLSLRYAKQAVTTRQPMITAEAIAGDLLQNDFPALEFRLEIIAGNGQIVGALGPHATVVDAASQLVRIPAGETARLPVRLEEDYEGEFIVRAVNPDTLVEIARLALKTAYEV